jgi:hypothetical protein
MRRLLLAAPVVALLALPVASAHGKTSHCGDYSTKVNGSKLTVKDVTASGIACAPAERLIKQCITMVGPSSSWKLKPTRSAGHDGQRQPEGRVHADAQLRRLRGQLARR